MGLPGRTSRARILLPAVVLSGLALAPRAAVAGVVDNRRTPMPGSATLPVRGPIPAGAGSFAPGRVLVGLEAGAGERRRWQHLQVPTSHRSCAVNHKSR
jgi:hypothetical protein